MRRPKFAVRDPEKVIRDPTSLRVRYRDTVRLKAEKRGRFIQQQKDEEKTKGQKAASPPESFKPSRPNSAPAIRHKAAQRRLKVAKEEYGKVETTRILVQWLRQHNQSSRVVHSIKRKQHLQTWFASLSSGGEVATREELELSFLGFGLIDSREDLDRLFKDNGLESGTAGFEQFCSILDSIREDRVSQMLEALDSIFSTVTEHKSFSQQYDIHRRNKFMTGIMASKDLSKTEQKQFLRTFRAMAARIST
jgi:hypothetical protein